MKRHLLILIVLTSLMTGCSNSKKRAREHFVKANEYFENENFMGAYKEIEVARQLDSTNCDYAILVAEIKSETNLEGDAIEILKDVLTKNFKLDTVNYLIGDCYFKKATYYSRKKRDDKKKLENYEQAIRYYDYTLSKNSQYFNAYISKQRTLHNLHRYDEALVIMNNAIVLFPDSISLVLYRGVERNFLGDNFGAMADMNRSLQSDKLDSTDLATAFRFRGNIFYERDSIDRAVMDLTNAIDYNPKDELAYAARGGYYKEMGLRDKACADYRKSAELGYVVIYETIKEYCER